MQSRDGRREHHLYMSPAGGHKSCCASHDNNDRESKHAPWCIQELRVQQYACSVVLLTLLLSRYEATRSWLAGGVIRTPVQRTMGVKQFGRHPCQNTLLVAENSNLKISRT